MNIIVCLDDNRGMLFNNRRQSRDKAVIQDIITHLQGETLSITGFSAKLFTEYESVVFVTENVSALGEGQWLFCESFDPVPLQDKVEKLVVYNWNRVYPADCYCSLDFSAFSLESETEFAGNSHDKITKQIFTK